MRKVIRIDGHVHLTFISPEHRTAYFARATALGESYFINGGYNQKDWEDQLKLKIALREHMATCFGLHPWWIVKNADQSQLLETEFRELSKLVSQADFIGETGLDRYHALSPKQDKLQLDYFDRHLDLADRFQKPLVLHIVKAHTDALKLLESRRNLCGIVHGFAGAPELARRYRRLGFYLSIGPGILASGYRKLKDTVAALEVEDFVIESDSPQDPEDPTAEPDLLERVAGQIAALKGVSPAEVLEVSNHNLKTLWG